MSFATQDKMISFSEPQCPHVQGGLGKWDLLFRDGVRRVMRW